MGQKTTDKQGSGKRRRMIRILSIIVGLVVVVAVAFTLLNAGAEAGDAADTEEGGADQGEEGEEGEGEEEEKAPIPVEVSAVHSGTVSAYITSSANLVAENQVKLLAEVEGRVSRLFVEEGDWVQRGQVLAMLVRDDEEIGLKKAQLKETNARLAYERGQDLMTKELLSREDFDRFTMDHEIARQELAEAQWNLERTAIRAPFSGRLSERIIQVGQHMQPGDELFQVTDFEPLIARIYLPERDVMGLEEGRSVLLLLNADESVRMDGRIRQISPVVDVATGTVKITIEATNPPSTIRPGSFVTINIVRETHEGALLLPREAVLRELRAAHVFVASGDLAEKREVQLGLEEGDFVEATTGIELGELVIVAGQGGLKDGSPLKILGAEEEKQEQDNQEVG